MLLYVRLLGWPLGIQGTFWGLTSEWERLMWMEGSCTSKCNCVARMSPAEYRWGSVDMWEGDGTRLEGCRNAWAMILGVGLCLCVSERSTPESTLSMCKGPEEAFENLQMMPCPSAAEQEEIQEKRNSSISWHHEGSEVTSSKSREPSGTIAPNSRHWTLLCLLPFVNYDGYCTELLVCISYTRLWVPQMQGTFLLHLCAHSRCSINMYQRNRGEFYWVLTVDSALFMHTYI